MRISLFALTAFVAAVFAHEGHDNEDPPPPPESDVRVLYTDSFNDWVNGEELALVEFYAPWCGHCKALLPEYEKAATALKPEGIKLAKIDCTVEKDVCTTQGVNGYPTLKVFRKGVSSEYKGQRTADSIIGYMKKQALPALSEIKPSELKEFKSKDKVVVVGYFSDSISKKFKAFEAVANTLRDDFVFGYTTGKVDGVKPPSVVLYKSFDEGENTFDDKYTEEALTSFIKTNAVPLIDDIGPENYQTYVQTGLPLAFTFVADDAQRKELAPIVEPIARSARGKINFVYIDASKYGSHAKSLNLKEGEWPAFAINEVGPALKYPFTGKKITAKALKAFVDEYLTGEMEPSLKSEPIPAKNDEPVKVVVGKNFEDIVLDKTKDVLLEVYAPWCGHCKKLAPVWEELGALLKDDKNIVIAKMDGTENDFPKDSGLSVQAFPTIKLFKAKDNAVLDYESGDRTLEPLLEFLKKNAVNGKKIKATVTKSADDDDDSEHDEL